jgi:hypothetical protein
VYSHHTMIILKWTPDPLIPCLQNFYHFLSALG